MSILQNLKDWIAYRLKTLDQMELKLRRMRRIAIKFRDGKVDSKKRETLEKEFHKLQAEVDEMDEKSKNENKL